MATVQTVLGPIDASELGRTLVHEHIRIGYPGEHLDPAYAPDQEATVQTAVDRIRGLMDHGVRTFVDPCPIDLLRDPELMAEVSRRSGMHIVCTTGFYHEHIGVPHYWRMRTSDEIADFYLHEIRNGIGETGIRPGAIKIASFDPPGDYDRKVITGAAIASARSGLPIISHCENSRAGEVQQEILAAHDVDLTRVLIGHQDQAPDAAQLLSLAAAGTFVGVDRVGIEVLSPDAHRVELITGVIDGGRAEQLCISQDHACCYDAVKSPFITVPTGEEETYAPMLEMVAEQAWKRPHTFLFTDFIPKLTAAGVTDAMIDTILVDNPARLLAG